VSYEYRAQGVKAAVLKAKQCVSLVPYMPLAIKLTNCSVTGRARSKNP